MVFHHSEYRNQLSYKSSDGPLHFGFHVQFWGSKGDGRCFRVFQNLSFFFFLFFSSFISLPLFSSSLCISFACIPILRLFLKFLGSLGAQYPNIYALHLHFVKFQLRCPSSLICDGVSPDPHFSSVCRDRLLMFSFIFTGFFVKFHRAFPTPWLSKYSPLLCYAEVSIGTPSAPNTSFHPQLRLHSESFSRQLLPARLGPKPEHKGGSR